jgi:hypothetical protein
MVDDPHLPLVLLVGYQRSVFVDPRFPSIGPTPLPANLGTDSLAQTTGRWTRHVGSIRAVAAPAPAQHWFGRTRFRGCGEEQKLWDATGKS